MFGLESQKKKKPNEEFVFELEKELRDPAKHREIRQRVEERLQKIKEILRSGDDQEEFDRFGVLLHGYNSLLKVMSRFTSKTK
jgi:DNA-binding transcriptional regulator GbsR (MarR family)